MANRPLIIDCDPGVDDLQAIFMARGSEQFDILGITAVAGNVPLEATGANALYIAKLLGLGCPVALGAARPMVFEMPREASHGAGGLGGMEVPREQGFYKKPAWELIYEKAVECAGKLELLAVGPLTNIAIAVLKYPQLADLIKRVVVMGGSATAGNVSPYAEFNAYQDPFAMSVVLEAGFKNLVLVDLDACHTAYLTDAEAKSAWALGDPVGGALKKVITFRQQTRRANLDSMTPEQREKVLDRNVACDAAAAAVLIAPSIAELDSFFVICETQSGLNYGQTVVDWTNRFNRHPNAIFTLKIDRDKYAQLYLACMTNLAERSKENE